MMNGVYLDLIDIYLVITGFKRKSSNRKTGEMLQSYIVDKNSIYEKTVFGAKCKDCTMVDKCYVKMDKIAVRRTLKKVLNKESNCYKNISCDELIDLLKDKSLRFGTYGDPSALPIHLVINMCNVLKQWTGYTHFWKTCNPLYSLYFMASVESLELKTEANQMGWRTFEVILDNNTNYSDGIQCPAITKGINCIDCGLCKGNSIKAKNIWINEH